MQIQNINVAKIKVPQSRPMPGPKRVQELADSILRVGLLHPIGVTEDFHLIHGRGRIQAYRALGLCEIPAVVHPLKDLEAELAELDENLIRKKFSKMEEARHLRRRKQLYEARHPETKKGGAPGKSGGGKKAKSDNLSSFAEDTAQKTGKSRRSVERDVELGEQLQAVPEDVQEQIAETPLANNKAQLKALASLEPETQREVVEVVKSGQAKTVAAALGALEGPEEQSIDVKAASEGLRKRVMRLVTRWVEKTRDIDAAVKVLRAVARKIGG